MIIYLHVGLDKSGSTAIQRALGLNQSWLNTKGYLFPSTGRVFGGHHEGLFTTGGENSWEQFSQELDGARQAGSRAAVISWEGVHFLSASRLSRFKALLHAYELKVILYLRDQAELIQSGYFQQMKQKRMNLTVSSFELIDEQLMPESRNYAHKIAKLEQVFGKQSLDVRLYDRENFVGQDIVTDFFKAVSLELDSTFQFPYLEANPSLDLPAVMLLNLVDRFYEDPDGRRQMVNQLLLDIDENGNEGKYFLDENAVDRIRNHYRASNREVLAQCFPGTTEAELFPRATFAYRTATDEQTMQCAAAKLTRIADSNTPAIWNGEALTGESLGLLCRQGNGWALAEDSGVCTRGSRSGLCFIIPPIKLLRKDGGLQINFGGEYLSPGSKTQLCINGQMVYKGSIEDTSIEISLDNISGGCLDIQLVQQESTATLARNDAEDDRELTFQLNSLSYALQY